MRGWCPRADGPASVAELRRAFAAIVSIPDAERATLAAALAAQPYAPGELGTDCAYRGATFAHYGAGLVWRRPPGTLWRVAPCDRAPLWFGDAILVVELPAVSIAVIPDDDVLDGGAARWVDDNLATRTRPIDLSAANPALGIGVEAVWREGKVETFVHRVVPLVGERRFRVHVYGSVARLRELDAEVRTALAALAPRIVKSPDERGNTLLDVRAGYSMELPGWARTDHTLAPATVDRSWRARDAYVGVVVEAGRRDHAVSRLRSRRRTTSLMPLPTTTEVAIEVEGRPAVRLSWSEYGTQVTAILVENHDALYTIWTRGDARASATALGAFRFIDQPD